MKTKTTPDNFEFDLAGLYDEPLSEAEIEEMMDRLFGFVGLLVEIDSENEKGDAA